MRLSLQSNESKTEGCALQSALKWNEPFFVVFFFAFILLCDRKRTDDSFRLPFFSAKSMNWKKYTIDRILFYASESNKSKIEWKKTTLCRRRISVIILSPTSVYILTSTQFTNSFKLNKSRADDLIIQLRVANAGNAIVIFWQSDVLIKCGEKYIL